LLALALSSFVDASMAADLIGLVLDRDGQPRQGVQVTLTPPPDGKLEPKATSDLRGKFLIRGLRPGDYEMKCGNHAAVLVRIGEGVNELNCRV
jgi:hypothetical protein